MGGKWGEEKKKPVWNEEDKLPKPVSMRCERRMNELAENREQVDWAQVKGEDMWRDQRKERKDKKTKLNALLNMKCGWLGGWV